MILLTQGAYLTYNWPNYIFIAILEPKGGLRRFVSSSKESVMQVTNETPDPLVAFGIVSKYGYGEDVRIEPGETKEVSGPELGHLNNGKCYASIAGAITCRTTSDGDNAYQVIPGRPLVLHWAGHGITVRHHLDPVEAKVLGWRMTWETSPSSSLTA